MLTQVSSRSRSALVSNLDGLSTSHEVLTSHLASMAKISFRYQNMSTSMPSARTSFLMPALRCEAAQNSV